MQGDDAVDASPSRTHWASDQRHFHESHSRANPPLAAPPLASAKAAEVDPALLSSESDEPSSSDTDYPRPYTPIPTSVCPSSLTTFGYQRALRNRIADTKLRRKQVYDMHKYTPTFVHDALMLPGSLSNIVGHGSSEDVIHRMTPGLLKGFNTYVHGDTHQPCLLPSADPSYHVQGMVIFGQGKRGRKCIHRHYRPHARRVKVQVEIDVVAGDSEVDVAVESFFNPAATSQHAFDRTPKLQRITIWAHAWLWACTTRNDVPSSMNLLTWNLDGFLIGRFSSKETLDVDASTESELVEGDERADSGTKRQRPNSEDADGAHGVGLLDYTRSDGFTGW